MVEHEKIFIQTLQELTNKIRDVEADVFSLRCEIKALKSCVTALESCIKVLVGVVSLDSNVPVCVARNK